MSIYIVRIAIINGSCRFYALIHHQNKAIAEIEVENNYLYILFGNSFSIVALRKAKY